MSIRSLGMQAWHWYTRCVTYSGTVGVVRRKVGGLARRNLSDGFRACVQECRSRWDLVGPQLYCGLCLYTNIFVLISLAPFIWLDHPPRFVDTVCIDMADHE